MRKLIPVAVFGILVSLGATTGFSKITRLAEVSDVPPAEENVVPDSNRFALDLYGQLRSQPGNLFFSPASLSTALAMAYAGAAGQTAEQMAAVLHFSLPPSELPEPFGAFQNNLLAAGEGRLKIANRLWGASGYPFRPEFLALTREHFGAELSAVPFASDPESARKTINAWIESQTNDKIRDLLPADAVDQLTRLVLTNAVYFKGNWASPFRKESTKDADFFETGDKSTRVKMMARKGHYRHFAGEGLQALELPYQGDKLSMLVLLPDDRDGLPDLERALSLKALNRWTAGASRKEVRVFLPRFRMESQFSLADTLQEMGLTLPFDQLKADFSGIATGEDLYISAVIHKAFVDVNEEGTEAAAATGVAVAARAMPSLPAEPPVFRADHPFLFAIRDNATGTLLFLGRVNNPNG